MHETLDIACLMFGNDPFGYRAIASTADSFNLEITAADYLIIHAIDESCMGVLEPSCFQIQISMSN
jgi:hypothetical protein